MGLKRNVIEILRRNTTQEPFTTTEVANALEAAENTKQDIANLKTTDSNLSTRLSQEISDRTKADAILNGDLNSITTDIYELQKEVDSLKFSGGGSGDGSGGLDYNSRQIIGLEVYDYVRLSERGDDISGYDLYEYNCTVLNDLGRDINSLRAVGGMSWQFSQKLLDGHKYRLRLTEYPTNTLGGINGYAQVITDLTESNFDGYSIENRLATVEGMMQGATDIGKDTEARETMQRELVYEGNLSVINGYSYLSSYLNSSKYCQGLSQFQGGTVINVKIDAFTHPYDVDIDTQATSLYIDDIYKYVLSTPIELGKYYEFEIISHPNIEDGVDGEITIAEKPFITVKDKLKELETLVGEANATLETLLTEGV